MSHDELTELFYEHRDMAYNIAKSYKQKDIDKVTDLAIDGLMRAVYSIEDRDDIENFDFKSLVMFYIKSEINNHMS